MKQFYRNAVGRIVAACVMAMVVVTGAFAQLVPPDFGPMAEDGAESIFTNLSAILPKALVVLGAFIGLTLLIRTLKRVSK